LPVAREVHSKGAMKKTPIAIVVLLAGLIGCGSSNKQSNEPEPAAQALENAETAEPAEPTADNSGTGTPAGTGDVEQPEQGSSESIPTPTEETPAANNPAVPAAPAMSERAEAELKLLRTGASIGTLGFMQSGGTTTMTGKFAGLPPGEHGFHIHEKGDCGGKNAKNAGGHLNPTGVKHGPPESSTRHAGDLGNLVVDEDGNATFDMATDSLTVAAGADSVVDRAVIIHAKKDDGKSQPSGNSGDPIACGVIRKVEGQSVSVIVK
jgi:Cu-Zn family superoxide dismutase